MFIAHTSMEMYMFTHIRKYRYIYVSVYLFLGEKARNIALKLDLKS